MGLRLPNKLKSRKPNITSIKKSPSNTDTMANKMWKDSESEHDFLHFNYLAEQVIDISKDDNLSPATIGIYGDWGSGKSTLMKMVKNTLDADKKTLTVEFNGWLFEGYEDAKTALCGTILDEMHKHEKLFAKGKNKIEALLKKVDGGKLLSKGIKYGLDYLSSPLRIESEIYALFYISRRPSIARSSVASSANSRLLPTGIP